MNNNLIDQLIKKIEQKDYDSKGSFSKCYLFDNYALLYGLIDTINIDKLIKEINKAVEKGIPLTPILDYKIDETNKTYDVNNNVSQYQLGWTLQKKALGKEVHNHRFNKIDIKKEEDIEILYNQYKVFFNNYLNELKIIVNCDQRHINQFLKNLILLYHEYNILVDGSRTTNFFYDKQKGFLFVDLSYIDHKVEDKFDCIISDFVTVLLSYVPSEFVVPLELKEEILENMEKVITKSLTAMKCNDFSTDNISIALNMMKREVLNVDKSSMSYQKFVEASAKELEYNKAIAK